MSGFSCYRNAAEAKRDLFIKLNPKLRDGNLEHTSGDKSSLAPPLSLCLPLSETRLEEPAGSSGGHGR